MDDALLITTASRNLRRRFAADISGLEAFADGLATIALGNPVTLTHSMLEGGGGGGQVTMAREIWLHAAEELLADPRFNPSAQRRIPRVVVPDYRFCNPV